MLEVLNPKGSPLRNHSKRLLLPANPVSSTGGENDSSKGCPVWASVHKCSVCGRVNAGKGLIVMVNDIGKGELQSVSVFTISEIIVVFGV